MFREEAIKNKDRMLDNKVVLQPSISPIYYVVFSSIMLTIIISFIIFGSYTRKIDVTGEVIIKPFPIILESKNGGYIEKIFVKKGQKVKTGDSIFLIVDNQFIDSETTNDTYSLEIKNLQQQLRYMKIYISNLDSQILSLKSSLVRKKKLENHINFC